jgi:diadenosine tetraphosphatase ApaH/serine/threonine PP2A family protein phosphatase
LIIAVVSDVHSNLEALEAVLDDIRGLGAERIWCLGDIVGYGADPNAVCDRLVEAAQVSLAGNHDWAAVGKIDASSFNGAAAAAVAWTSGQLSTRTREWLSGLPLVHLADGTRLVHATPSDPAAWQYVFSAGDAEGELGTYQEPLCLVGHSHVPANFEADGLRVRVSRAEVVPLVAGRRYLINVGSVGQPRDGDPRAAFLVYDTERQELAHRRVAYDIEKAAAKILAAGLPPFLATRLARGA